jgi:prepilin-type N-terminal cleavage/methylation domain-containing protein
VTSTSRDPTASRPADRRRPAGARGAGGFTLIEVAVAFAILAIVVSSISVALTQSLDVGVEALNLRDVREMSDTVFRKFVYELGKYTDGMTDTGDHAYGEWAGLKGTERDRWKIYRLVFHKKKGMAAGNDPSGQTGDLFGGLAQDDDGRTTTGTTTGGTTGTSGSDAATGVEAYLLSLEVFYTGEESENPLVRLRTVVPVPREEQTEDAR